MLPAPMISLRQILGQHGPILVLDAASTRVQVGLLRADADAIWKQPGEDAGKSLFAGTKACLDEAKIGVDAVNGFAFCDGPGSMLGIRTAAMAIRTWLVLRPRPVFRYSSLTLLAHHLLRSDRGNFSVIADARRDSWHLASVEGGNVSPLRRAASAELAGSGEKLVLPSSFRAWSHSPRATVDAPYAVAGLLATEADTPLFSATDAPDGYQAEPPTYKKWSAQVHSRDTVAHS
ncbi:MAG TPA: hypothetical protein VHD32_12160 [Candidatus Didemnitutus sp.]|nr:hypothetical protein [Candidatus Didemnitutus sp.]